MRPGYYLRYHQFSNCADYKGQKDGGIVLSSGAQRKRPMVSVAARYLLDIDAASTYLTMTEKGNEA
jgi:hypothetical protein